MIDLILTGTDNIYGATGLEDIRNCLNTIATTAIGTVPLYREFGTDWTFLDAPTPVAMAKFRAALFDAFEKWEKRVKVTSISFRPDTREGSEGHLIPVVKYHIKEGVTI